jgi:hypothetical protein
MGLEQAGPKRKHVATGRKPPGGSRPGAGRPSGRNVLPYGAVKAIKALRHRVPEGTPDKLADLADRALERVAEVMEGEILDPMLASAVLRASTRIRDEVCGPPKQVVHHEGKVTLEQLVAGSMELEPEDAA